MFELYLVCVDGLLDVDGIVEDEDDMAAADVYIVQHQRIAKGCMMIEHNVVQLFNEIQARCPIELTTPSHKVPWMYRWVLTLT